MPVKRKRKGTNKKKKGKKAKCVLQAMGEMVERKKYKAAAKYEDASQASQARGRVAFKGRGRGKGGRKQKRNPDTTHFKIPVHKPKPPKVKSAEEKAKEELDSWSEP